MAGKNGGKRPGAGRKKGSKGRATIKHKATLAELARDHTDLAINTLIDIAKNGESESARISAVTALLDRGYGKPRQEIDARVSLDLDALPDEEFDAVYDLARRVTGRGA